jgi:hypothetical protein
VAQLPHHRLGSLRLSHGFRQALGFPYCLKNIIRNLVVEYCTDKLKSMLIPVRDKIREVRKDMLIGLENVKTGC